ncbi:HD domain-containing phosphohydrolase [Halobacteriovorax sp. HLS]|uniref:HD domain-containing phosphohydrolase n=1 Tax=Halobacteriovorax sp. HLS TaxID=2234000 RepID=UPI000FD9FF94|nr:HD domain-containing phosphohydrolase [Halobacteriovorax sp. HLS]
MNKSKIILIGNNKNLLDLICFSLQTNFRFEVIKFTNIVDLIEYMGENDDFCLIISDYALGEKQFSNTLKTFVDKKAKVPFFALGVPKKFKEKNENRDSISEFIGKTNLLEDLNIAVKKYFQVDENETPKDFCEVSFSVLTAFDGLETDLFIELPTGRYLKIYRTEDEITEEDVTKYQNKGVEDLFLHKKVSSWLLKTINKDIENIVTKIESNQEVKLEVEPPMPNIKDLKNVDEAKSEEEVIEKIEEAKEEEKKFEEINQKVDQLFKFDKKMEKEVSDKVSKTLKAVKKVPSLAKLLKKLNVSRNPDDYCKQHVNLLCKICTAICHVMEWRQEATIEKLVFVSYLHDITLSDHPHLARLQTKEDFEKVKDSLSAKEQALFLNHPEQIKELVDKMQETPADASTIILQHHENCAGTGFPYGHSSNRLLPLTAVFIIAHDLVNYIINEPNWNIKDFTLIASERYSGSNFNKVIRKLKDLKI